MPDKPISSQANDASNRRRRTLHNVIEFPEASGAAAWDAGLMIVFELDRRFAIDWNVTELNQKPAEVIPILKKRHGKSRVRPHQV
jgi:hypothetical protein